MRKFILVLATVGGVGYLPFCPGLAGSLVGLLIYWSMMSLPPVSYLATVLAFAFFSVWVSSLAEVLFHQKDAHVIVIDEVAGMLVTLSLVPFSPGVVVVGFVLFRIFDVWKPFPVRLCQDRLPGGWGVVGDDVAAGIYANLVLQVVVRFW